MTDKELDIFLQQCHKEVREKQKYLTTTYKINEYTTYSFSQGERSIKLKKSSNESLIFKVKCIGSWHQEDRSWVWGWANENLSETIREEAKSLKELEKVTGFNIFLQGAFAIQRMNRA